MLEEKFSRQRLTFWQIYAVCVAVDVAGRLLLHHQDVAILLAAPPVGWTLPDLLLVTMWLGFEAAWAFVLAFILHSLRIRLSAVREEKSVNPGVHSESGPIDSPTR